MEGLALERFKSVIKQEVTLTLKNKAANPLLNNITITHVDLSKELSWAKLYWSSVDAKDDKMIAKIELSLKNAASFCRKELAKTHSYFRTPALTFVFDKAYINYLNVDKILKDHNNKE